MATVVEAVGAGSATLDRSRSGVSRLIELAMAQAVQDCVDEGIPLSDSETIKARMMQARDRIKEAAAAKAISSTPRSKRIVSPKAPA